MSAKKLIALILAGFLAIESLGASAQSADQLRQNIDSHNERIKQLDAEIRAYEKQIEAVGNEAKSLQSAIQVLDISQKKISAEIKKTETSIQATNLTIQKLGGQIGDTEQKVALNMNAVSKTLNYIDQNDDISLIENLLDDKSLSEILDEYESASEFQQKVRTQADALRDYKAELSDQKTSTEKEKAKLVSLGAELRDQNQILASNKKEKNNLSAGRRKALWVDGPLELRFEIVQFPLEPFFFGLPVG